MLSLFAGAASLLLGDKPEGASGGACLRLLEALGYARPDRSSAGEAEFDAETVHRARLLRAASQFIRIFELNAPEAPGLVGLGAEIDPALADPLHAGSTPVSASGVGLTLQQAFQACVGEAVEYLSQLETSGDSSRFSCPSSAPPLLDPAAQDLVKALASFRGEPGAGFSRYPAIRLSDRTEALLPADLCLRRPPSRRDFTPPFPLSVGSAAGTSWEAAALHGLLELIERDAASLWWRGGIRGRPIAGQSEARGQALLRELRATAPMRRATWFLDITTDVGIPVVAALSSQPDGFGLAFGLAARPTVDAAVRSATLEMCQIELAYAVVGSKRKERGEAALNAVDRAHLRRATTIDAKRCELLHPIAERAEHLAIGALDPHSVLQSIVQRLHALGIEAYALDLTRPRFAIPVARIIAPGLQLEPSGIATARLSATIARTGGGAIYTGGAPLI